MSELADRLDGWSNWFRDPDDTRRPKTDHISVMREAAAALRAQEWVSAEEPPEEDGSYTVWNDGRQEMLFYYVSKPGWENEHCFACTPTYWMKPLPAPPEQPV